MHLVAGEHVAFFFLIVCELVVVALMPGGCGST
jgi:hypothetical protein